jgi:hypothetical protein
VVPELVFLEILLTILSVDSIGRIEPATNNTMEAGDTYANFFDSAQLRLFVGFNAGKPRKIRNSFLP